MQWIATFIKTHYEIGGKEIFNLNNVSYNEIARVVKVHTPVDTKIFKSKSNMKKWLKQNGYTYSAKNQYMKKSYLREYKAYLTKIEE